MQNKTTPADGLNSAQLEAKSALRDAACSRSSETPETDAQTWKGHCGDGDWGNVVYAHWAQKMERERDEAIRTLRVFKSDMDHLGYWMPDPCRAMVEKFLENATTQTPT